MSNSNDFVDKYGGKTDGSDNSSKFLGAVKQISANGGGNLTFPEGTFIFNSEVVFDGIFNVTITGEKGTVIKKNSSYVGQGIWTFNNSFKVSVRDLCFEGYTTDTVNSHWGDDGVLFVHGSDIDVYDCFFRNFGDSALRIRSRYFSVKPLFVEMDRIRVERNTFENVQQTSNTQGGTSNYIFKDNIAISLKGSFKFASEIQGSGRQIISGNIVEHADKGIEIMSGTNLIISDNIISNCIYGIFMYSNINLSTTENPAFPWGNINVHDNNITNCKVGIGTKNAPYKGGKTFVLKGIRIKDNIMDYCDKGISLNTGYFYGSKIINNSISNCDNIAIQLYPKADNFIQPAFCYINNMDNSRNCIRIEALITGIYKGLLGNGVTVIFANNGVNSSLSVSAVQSCITVVLETDSTGKIKSTLNDVITAFNASPIVNTDFAAYLCEGGIGTTICSACTETLGNGFNLISEDFEISGNDILGNNLESALGVSIDTDINSTRNLKNFKLNNNNVYGYTNSGSKALMLDNIDTLNIYNNDFKNPATFRGCTDIFLKDNNISGDNLTLDFYASKGINPSNIVLHRNKITTNNGTTSIRYNAVCTNIEEIDNVISSNISRNGTVPFIKTKGIGSPEGVIYGSCGSEYTRLDGGLSTCKYIKETATTNTGWVAK